MTVLTPALPPAGQLVTETLYGPGDSRFLVRTRDGAALLDLVYQPVLEVLGVRVRPVMGPGAWAVLPGNALQTAAGSVLVPPGRLTWPAGRYGYIAQVTYRHGCPEASQPSEGRW